MESLILHFLLGCAIGPFVVGSSVVRTIAIDKGDLNRAFWGSILNSVSYFLSVVCIARGDNVAYVGTAISSTILCLYMAHQSKGKLRGGEGIRLSEVVESGEKR